MTLGGGSQDVKVTKRMIVHKRVSSIRKWSSFQAQGFEKGGGSLI